MRKLLKYFPSTSQKMIYSPINPAEHAQNLGVINISAMIKLQHWQIHSSAADLTSATDFCIVWQNLLYRNRHFSKTH